VDSGLLAAEMVLRLPVTRKSKLPRFLFAKPVDF
jgi:hypothetical protein